MLRHDYRQVTDYENKRLGTKKPRISMDSIFLHQRDDSNGRTKKEANSVLGTPRYSTP